MEIFTLLTISIIVSIWIIQLKNKCSVLMKAKNKTATLLSLSEQECRKMRSDIKLLVSNNPAESAAMKQVYDKWRAEFNLTEKSEINPPI